MSDGMNYVCRGLGQIAANEIHARAFEFQNICVALFDDRVVRK